MTNSFKVECLAYGELTWSTNALRFPTMEQANAYALELSSRWTGLKDWRIQPSEHPVNSEFIYGQVVHRKELTRTAPLQHKS